MQHPFRLQTRQRLTFALGANDVAPTHAFLNSVAELLPIWGSDGSDSAAAVQPAAAAQLTNSKHLSAQLVPLLQRIASQGSIWGPAAADAEPQDPGAPGDRFAGLMAALSQALYRASLTVRFFHANAEACKAAACTCECTSAEITCADMVGNEDISVRNTAEQQHVLIHESWNLTPPYMLYRCASRCCTLCGILHVGLVSIDSCEMTALGFFLQVMPASVRGWYNAMRLEVPGLSTQSVKAAIRSYTALSESPQLVRSEIAAAEALKNPTLEIITSTAAQEIVAAVEVDEGSMLELSFHMPEAFPLQAAVVRTCDVATVLDCYTPTSCDGAGTECRRASLVHG